MQKTTQLGREERHVVRRALLSGVAAPERSGIGRTFERLKTTLDAGESEWTMVLVLAIDYAIAGSLFLIMLALVEIAYHFG